MWKALRYLPQLMAVLAMLKAKIEPSNSVRVVEAVLQDDEFLTQHGLDPSRFVTQAFQEKDHRVLIIVSRNEEK